MKPRDIKSFVLSLLFCSLSVNVCGQGKLDEVIVSNRELTQKVEELKQQLSSCEDSIRHLKVSIGDDTLLRNKAKREKDSLEILNRKEYQAMLKAEVAELDSINKVRLLAIKKLEKDLEAKRQQLSDGRDSLSAMSVFSDDLKEKKLKENMQYTQKPFSQMDGAWLQELYDGSDEFSNLELYDEYTKRLRYAKSMLDIYHSGIDVISSPYDEFAITFARDSITDPTGVEKDNLKAGVFKLTEEQFNELDSLDIKLSRFKDGMIALQKIIYGINADQEIAKLRESGDRNQKSRLVQLVKPYVIPEAGTERHNNQERFFNMVPYLGKMLRNYWNEISKDPFLVPTKTEEEILKTIVEE